VDVSEDLRRLPEGRSRQRLHRILVALPVAAVVLAFALVAVPELGDRTPEPAVAEVPLRLSALEDRVRLGETGRGAMDTTRTVHPGEGTLVARRGSQQIFLVEAAGDRLCVLAVDEGSGGASTGCGHRSDLLTTGVIHAYSPTASRLTVVVVAVPDGYSRATAGDVGVPVISNAAVLELDPPPTELVLSGPELPTVTLELGRAAATAGGVAPASTRESNARIALTDLIDSARGYEQRRGSTAGFAKHLLAGAPALGGQLASLTDTAAVAAIAPGRCLTASFSSGAIEEITC
jgi:hypothetical protein